MHVAMHAVHAYACCTCACTCVHMRVHALACAHVHVVHVWGRVTHMHTHPGRPGAIAYVLAVEHHRDEVDACTCVCTRVCVYMYARAPQRRGKCLQHTARGSLDTAHMGDLGTV